MDNVMKEEYFEELKEEYEEIRHDHYESLKVQSGCIKEMD